MKALVFVIFALLALNVQAQTDQPRHRITLMTGFGSGQWQDQSYSPFSYDARSALWQFGCERSTQRGHIFVLETQSIAAKLTPETGDQLESEMIGFELQSAWLWKLKETTRWQFHLGPEYSIGSQVTTPENSGSSYTYVSTHGLSATGRANYQLNRWNFTGQLSLPLLIYAARPPYADFTEGMEADDLLFRMKNGDWQSLGNYVAPEVRIQAEYELRRWIGLAAQYHFAYQDLETSQPLSSSTHHVQLGVNFKF
ncbi:MAG: hypothetical protein ACFB15_27900 [Cyclobacteriaceae bacterium]